jgi:hypothetical protein
MSFNAEKNITVELVGGLGNQLFGLAFGAAVSNRLQCNLILDNSLINFGSNKSRVLELKNFDLTTLKVNYQQSFLTKFPILTKNTFVKRLITKFIKKAKNSLHENQIVQNYQYKIDSRFSGYFQDWKYADSLLVDGIDFKIEILSISDQLNIFLSELTQHDPTLVHIRLGDYLRYSNIYQILPEDYYLTALRELKVNRDTSPIWLIVEDKEQVKSVYPDLYKSAHKIIDKFSGIEDYESFYLMTRSKNLVASNSTFSLWASWFALNHKSNVIVPGEFMVSGQPSQIIDGRWDAIDLKSFKLLPKSNLESIRSNNHSKFNSNFRKL